MVRVEALPVVCQVEAAAPVRLRELVAVMLSVLMTMVLPMVAVATYIFPHLAVTEPRLYKAVVAGRRSPVIVVVAREVLAAVKLPPKIALPEP